MTTTKKQELKKQTWIYFWQQKLLELLIIPAVIGAGMLLALFARWLDPIMVGDGDLMCEELVGLGCWIGYAALGAMMMILIGMVLFVGGLAIAIFVKANWEKASERAYDKLNGVKR